MLHSYDGLDRGGGFSRRRLLAPLRHRDFRLLWLGMCVSLLGDGAFLVAIAWQVYELSSAPTALGIVGIALTVPTIACLLLGGVASDRLDRRRIMICADLTRMLAAGTLALLALTGVLELWHVVGLVMVYGTGQGFFAPAFDALVPELVPREELPQANALDQIARPVALRLAGPAIGGVLVGAFGAGSAFGLDAASFACSAAALLLMRRPAARARAAPVSLVGDLLEGWKFVRQRSWLWATFASAAVAYLLFMGPVEVLLPYLVKETLDGSATELGLVFAAGGFSSVLAAAFLGRRGLPRREITFIYAVWGLATLAVAGYGLAASIWQLMLASAAFNALETVGTIVWVTAKQRHVPADMLGRVSSLDWLISIGLLPLSFALTGPVSTLIGVQTTLVAAGLLGALVTLAGLLVPGVRSIEDPPRARSPTAARAALRPRAVPSRPARAPSGRGSRGSRRPSGRR